MTTVLLIAAALVAAPPTGGAEKRLDTITARRVEGGAPSEVVPRFTAPGRPSLTLALSGGGARGMAHVGVIEALLEDGVELDGIVGTSFGALVGALFAAGYEPEEVERFLGGQDWNDLLSGLDTRNRILTREEDRIRASAMLRMRTSGHGRFQVGALVDSAPLDRALYRYLLRAQLDSGGVFDRLRYRFRPVATDILTGRAVVPDHGDLVAAIRGSAAFPGVFRPVPFGDALLVDGGLVENVPAGSARELGTDVVLAVDVSERIPTGRGIRNALDLLNRSVQVLMAAQTRRSEELADLVLRPDVTGFPPSNLANLRELVNAGRAGYQASRDRLWSLLEERARDRSRIVYDRIEVEGTSRIDAAALARRLGGSSGSVTRFRVAAELARALNFGPFADGRVDWVATSTGRVLRFRMTEGPVMRGIVIEGAPIPEEGTPAFRLLGEPFSAHAARQIVASAREQVLDRGHALVAPDELTWNPETGTVLARVDDATVHDLSLEVVGPVRLEHARRFLTGLQGTRFRFDLLADRLDESVARGAIADWALEPSERDDGTVDLEVRVRADRYYGLSGALEYRDALGWAGALRATKSNLTGRGDFIEVAVAGARETEFAQVRYRTEYGVGFQNLGAEAGVRLFDNAFPVVNDGQVLVSGAEEGYSGYRGWVSLVERLAWGAVVQAGVFRERDRFDPTATEPRERRSRTSATFAVDLDRRDRLLFPTHGGGVTLRGEHSLSGSNLWKYELFADGNLSPGHGRRHTLGFRASLGLSGGVDRRPWYFDPGGYRRLYGFIPYGAAAPQYAHLGATWRYEWFDWGPARVYVETGVDAIRTSASRHGLHDAPTVYGYGASVTMLTKLLGPISLGVARNDRDADVLFLTFGYGLFDD